ncbi:MAG: MMPL family transporter [Deltaproteobacteria bacterium]|nr:MMPL family transporter [Deltaproteobacteria bacterium]MBN2672834.1 MMPL family transporter [Deltaproteobacteria bacterium]
MRTRMFRALAELVTDRPWLIFGGALLLAAVSMGVFEAKQVRFETRVLDLLPKDDPAAVEYNDILKQYDSASQIIIGVKGGTKEEKIAFINEAEKAALNVRYTSSADGKFYPYVKHTVFKTDTAFLQKHGLMLTKRSDLENLEVLFSNLEMADLLTAYNDFFEMEYIEDTAAVTEREKEDGAISNLKAIVGWLEGVQEATRKERAEHAAGAVASMTMGEQYMFSQDDAMLIGMVVPTVSMDRMEEIIDGAKNLRSAVMKVQKKYPSLNVRLTGMPVLSLEEMEVTEKDMGAGTVISLVLILALFIVAFRMWTAPFLAIVNLVIGIIWTLLVVALVFGRLNLMTGMFAIILIGLGIDFAIHLNAAYVTARAKTDSLYEAVLQMYNQSGSGVVTGAVTTAVAFFVLAFTGLDAFIELGVILGAGILFTLLSSMVVLPAMFVLTENGRRRFFKRAKSPRGVLPMPFLEKAGNKMMKLPLAIGLVVAFAGATAFFGLKAKQASFESNMLEIEPPDMPSVLLHKEVLKDFEINPDFAMLSVKTVDEARRIADRMKRNRLVGRVDAVSEYLPSSAQQQRRKPVVKAIAANMAPYMEANLTGGLPSGAVADFPAYVLKEKISDEERDRVLEELDRLNMNIKEIGQMAFVSMKKRLASQCTAISGGKDDRFSEILNLKKQFQQDKRFAVKAADYQRAYIPLLAEKLSQMADTSPITMDMLPDNIADRYVSDSGENLITIYSAVDLWDGNKMELFNKATAAISENITGTVVLMDRLITLIGSKGTLATLLALGAVFVILLIDFRHIGYALLGMLPLLCGFVWMIGLFTLFKFKFDVANVTAIPLILGIGIDDSVHILHGIKRGGVADLPRILKYTGRALILTSLTTAIAFGAIAFSSHRGLAGMGVLLTLGVGGCLLASIWLLPALSRLVFSKSNPTPKEVSK